MNISLTEFIKKSVSEIKDGMPEGYELTEDIEFEVSVGYDAAANGKADLKVLSLGASGSLKSVQKIKFSITNSEQQAKNVDAEAKTIEKFVYALFKPLMKMGKELESKKGMGSLDEL